MSAKAFIFRVFFVSALLILISLLFFFSGEHLYKNYPNEAFYEEINSVTVILDAGHGGMDGGASFEEIYEKDLNLQIADKIKGFLLLYDVDVVMTRTDDNLLAEDSSKNKKRDDLYNRVKLAEGYSSPMFVSIHMNKFPESKYKGLQVFYSPNNPYSEALALVVQTNNKTYLETDNNRQIKKATDTIYVLDRLTCPAILIECGFLSNQDDLKKLQDENYQNKLAYVISKSIIEYIKL